MYSLRLSRRALNCSYTRLRTAIVRQQSGSHNDGHLFEPKNNLTASDALFEDESRALEDKVRTFFPNHSNCSDLEYMDETGVAYHPYNEAKESTEVTRVNLLRKGAKMETQSMSHSQVHKDLKSYLHACVNSNAIDKAHYVLIWNRYKYFQNDQHAEYPVIGSSIYNIVYKGWAQAGKLNRFKELWRLMEMANCRPNLQSFACYFLCLSKLPNLESELMDEVFAELDKFGLKIEDICLHTTLNMEDRSIIRKLIHSHKPQVKFTTAKPNTRYDTKLLRNFGKLKSTIALKPELGSCNDLKQWYAEQVNMETTGWTKIKSVFEESDHNPEHLESLKSRWNKTEIEWRKVLLRSFERNLHMLKARLMEHQGTNVYAFLTAMEPKYYIEATFNEILHIGTFSEYFSPPVSLLHRILGEQVMYRYLTQVKIKDKYLQASSRMYNKYMDALTKRSFTNPRETCERIALSNNLSLKHDLHEMRWSSDICQAVGKFLYEIIINDVKIDANIISQNANAKPRLVPVIFTIYKTEKTHVAEEVRAHPNYIKLYNAVCQRELRFPSQILPMVVPPFPWLEASVGGYLISDTTFIRDHQYNLKNIPGAQLNPVIDSLNALSLQPWRINAKILDVIIEVFRNKGDLDLDIPLHASRFPPLPKYDKKKSGVDRLQIYKAQVKQKRERSEMYSLWCDCLYKLSIANHFRNRIFWFPHNLDFRGRVYACPPHFNHLGNDVARSILVFAKGKPLGPKGLDWLKIHLVNLTGLKKKSSIAERLEYANEIMPQILDSADNPLTGDRWWKESDEPWQTLACCMEVAAAVRCPDPETFVSHFPVHQDGSCNGLQHYAALGRDQQGAEAVNLHPSDRPQDVYMVVANLVEKERIADANGDMAIAKALDGFVQRKTVKQTVMTFVYGVTRYGARLQIFKRLKDNDKFPQEFEWGASMYLVHKVFDSIQEMFTATRQIQDWFGLCAHDISHSIASPVKWTDAVAARTTLYKPNTMKQKNAFAPNFIHSLDSSHMMLTALHCYRNNVDFVSVHDCFWTHPSTVDEMNVICRDQFVALHSLPILQELSESFLREYGPQLAAIRERQPEAYKKIVANLTNVPQTGTFDLNNVKDSVFFFS
ncbi:DNA-directed RNA polymerase, mitochondrial [Halotydeus destructor]|nr:DNA-directed RNA polymerase, mitochondrial [Halotydeus destructor]